MPPAKNRPAAAEESRASDVGNGKEKHMSGPDTGSRKSKNGNGGNAALSNMSNGTNGHKDAAPSAALINSAKGSLTNGAPATGVANGSTSWLDSQASTSLLETYRLAHNLPVPTAFSSSYRQALLTNPGIGRFSPTMARKTDKKRTSKDQLALAVRKHFNGMAVNEIDVVVEVIYRIKNKDKAFRMRSAPAGVKKS